MPEKKTEEQLRQEIIEEFSLEEDDERIDKILEIKKDRFTATQAKKKAQKEADNFKKGKDWYKKQAESKKTQEPKGDEGKEPNYSLQDIRALSDVHDDDVDRVTKFAKSEGISIPEAKKHPDMQAILRSRKEERETAAAANTGKTKRGSSKVSGEALLAKAKQKGELPESDDDMDALIEARYTPPKQ